MKTIYEFGVYCLICGHVRWGKHCEEIRKCPKCGNTNKLSLINVNKAEAENIKKLSKEAMSSKEIVNLDKVIEVLSIKEKDEKPHEKAVCKTCGNDTFRVYISVIIDDARLYCTKCGKDPEE